MSDPDGAMGAGGAEAPDIASPAGGDATGGGSPGDQDSMGADDGRTVDEGAGRHTMQDDEGESDEHAG
ncbi:hypothetical protein [Pseudolysinimonas sp.]